MTHKDLASSKGYVPKFHWVAVYHDDTTLSGETNTSDDIDRRRLKRMLIVDGEGTTVISQNFRPGQYLLYRARTVMRTGVGVLDRIHILGWLEHHSASGCNFHHVAFITESDRSIEMSYFVDPDSPEAVDHPWSYPIQLTETDLIAIEPPNHSDPDISSQHPDTTPDAATPDESVSPGPDQTQSS